MSISRLYIVLRHTAAEVTKYDTWKLIRPRFVGEKNVVRLDIQVAKRLPAFHGCTRSCKIEIDAKMAERQCRRETLQDVPGEILAREYLIWGLPIDVTSNAAFFAEGE
jgi:hypothetical protein